MKYLLDTNVWVDYLTARYPSVVKRIQESQPEDLYLSTVVMAELRYGAEKSQRKGVNHRLLDTLSHEVVGVDFDLETAAICGRLRATLEAGGNLIGPYDMMIAAQALSLDLVLVTDNMREFRRVKRLKLENWRR